MQANLYWQKVVVAWGWGFGIGKEVLSGGFTKRREFGGGDNTYFHYFECGDVSQLYTYVKIYQIIYLKYVQFVESQLHFNNILKLKKDTRKVQK